MKKIGILLLFIMLSVAGIAKERYVVDANTLNVRCGPNTTDAVKGSLNKGDVVVVNYKNKTWANISHKGNSGWVSKKYIHKLSSSSASGIIHTRLRNVNLGNTKVVYFFVLIGLGVLSGIIRYISLASIDSMPRYWLYLIISLITSLALINYFISVPGATWFFRDPEWYKIAFNFVLFLIFMVFMMVCLINLLDATAYHGYGEIKFKNSLIAVLVASVLGYFIDWIWDDQYAISSIVILGILVYQSIQAIKNLKGGYSVIFILMYALTVSIIVVVCYYCIVPLIIVALIGLAGLDSPESSSTGKTQVAVSNDESDDGSFYINGKYGRTKVEPQPGGRLWGDDRNWYYYSHVTGEYEMED